MKNIKKIALLFAIFISIFLLYNLFVPNDNITINFKNNTDLDIENLKLNYTNLPNDIDIPIIKSKSTYQLKIKPLNENFHEGDMKLYYINQHNEKVEILIIRYFEKGYIGNVDVNINKDGQQFKIESKENVHW